MTPVILSFACGVLYLQLQPELPAAGWVWAGLLALAGAVWNKTLRIPAAFAIGFCWALGVAHVKLADRLAPELQGRDIEVVGVVAGLPAAGERSLRFEFAPEHAEA
jgi:competence protein ComEC